MSSVTTSLAGRPSVLEPVRALGQLVRWRLGLLVGVVVAVAVLTAAPAAGDWIRLGHAVIGTTLVAWSASAINQYLERDVDARMRRTAARPLPAGRVDGRVVLVLGAGLLVAGLFQLGLGTTTQAACWAFVSWLIYVAAYTPLKRRSPWNTAIGSLSGALPAWIGYAAVAPPGLVPATADAWGLLLVVLFWQFPHFMAIAWLYRSDYARAGIRMATVVDPTGKQAGVQAVAGALGLLPACVLLAAAVPVPAAFWFLAAALLLCIIQLDLAIRFWRTPSDNTARSLFVFSLVYLPALLGVFLGAWRFG